MGAVALWAGWSQLPPKPPAPHLLSQPAGALADPVPAVEAADPPQIASAPQAPATPDVPDAPQLTVLRVAPDGQTVIAGSVSRPGPVRIMLADQLIAEVVPDASGKFAAFASLPPSEQPRRLVLEQNGARGDEDVIVAPFGPPDGAEAGEANQLASATGTAPKADTPTAETPEIASATGQGDATAPADTLANQDAGPALAQTEAQQPTDTAPTEPQTQTDAPGIDTPPIAIADADPAQPPLPQTGAAPVPAASGVATPAAGNVPVLIASANGARLLDGPPLVDELSLDTITYAPDGALILGGRSHGSVLRLYLDNDPVIDALVSRDGSWTVSLPDLAEGVYTLRVDALDLAGHVVGRIETPLQREAPREIAALLQDKTEREDFDVAVMTVEKGNSLWAIAEETYGDGVMYVEVYRANRDLIRDPDLIYPGQVFRLPKID